MPAQFMRKKYVAKEKWKVKQQRQDGTKYHSPNKAKADECQLYLPAAHLTSRKALGLCLQSDRDLRPGTDKFSIKILT